MYPSKVVDIINNQLQLESLHPIRETYGYIFVKPSNVDRFLISKDCVICNIPEPTMMNRCGNNFEVDNKVWDKVCHYL